MVFGFLFFAEVPARHHLGAALTVLGTSSRSGGEEGHTSSPLSVVPERDKLLLLSSTQEKLETLTGQIRPLPEERKELAVEALVEIAEPDVCPLGRRALF